MSAQADDAMRAVVALADSFGMTGAELITLANSHRLAVVCGFGDDRFNYTELQRIQATNNAVATVLGGYYGLNSMVRELAVMASAPGDNFNE